MKRALFPVLLIVLFGIVGANHGGFDDKSDPVMGDEDAQVTMEVWCDVQGPFCKQFDNNAFAQIKSEYVDHGKVKVVWRDKPQEAIHPWAMKGATAMECVHRESDSAFWEVLDRVYENQDTLDNETVQEEITEYAGETGVDEESMRNCLSEDSSDEVLSDLEEAESRNISGTPTIVINGQTVVGAQPYSEFKTIIESELDGNQSQDESSPEPPENDTEENSDTDATELQERLNESESNVTALKERLDEQEEEIKELEKQQNAIVEILSNILNLLGI